MSKRELLLICNWEKIICLFNLMLLNIQFCRSLAFQKYDLSWSFRYPSTHNWCCCFFLLGSPPSLSPYTDNLRVKGPDTEEFAPKQRLLNHLQKE